MRRADFFRAAAREDGGLRFTRHQQQRIMLAATARRGAVHSPRAHEAFYYRTRVEEARIKYASLTRASVESHLLVTFS